MKDGRPWAPAKERAPGGNVERRFQRLLRARLELDVTERDGSRELENVLGSYQSARHWASASLQWCAANRLRRLIQPAVMQAG